LKTQTPEIVKKKRRPKDEPFGRRFSCVPGMGVIQSGEMSAPGFAVGTVA
jgi:hypothetical protein